MVGLTQQLGSFVTGLKLQDVPADALHTAKTGFIDCFAVMIAGYREGVSDIIDRELASADHRELASVVPTGAKRNVEDAALINGVSAHVLDYDDVTLDGHPSAVLVPAILAQAEASHSSGAEMLLAYVAGYEVWCELLARESDPLHQKGWHPTALRGTVAAAAACARLRGLDAAQTTMAMALSASMAAGLVSNFGTLTKSFHVGRAAQSGVIAARLVQAGITASPDALEHPSGFLAATSPLNRPDLKRAFDPARKEWHLSRQGLNIKRYPSCYFAHRTIDATLDLANSNNLTSSDVERIRVFTGEMQMVALRNERPRTGFEAKFSMPFAVASAIVARKVGISQLTDEFVLRDDVQSIFPKVSYDLTKETMSGSAFAPEESVEIVTTSGKVLKSEKIKYAKGSHQRPLTQAELREKFDDCLGETFNDRAKINTFDRLSNLERVNSAADLLSLA
jgi:2-methylcitrate dehydratase PrpD